MLRDILAVTTRAPCAWVGVAALTFAVAGCGVKGPLRLPDPPRPAASVPAPAATTVPPSDDARTDAPYRTPRLP